MNTLPQSRLGRTKLQISVVAFGAGPVSGLMTGDDHALQLSVVQSALQAGINWFDTAAGYGQGVSESNLGRCLSLLAGGNGVHIATKVRVLLDDPRPLQQQIVEGIHQSLERLNRHSVTLLQLHNGVTNQRNDEPFSVCVDDVLGRNKIADVLTELKTQGLVRFIGLTGTGCPNSLRKVIRSGIFDTIQVPFNLLNPSAGRVMDDETVDRNYGNTLADCQEMDMGAFAIRVFAGGALLGRPASPHTLKTPFFPLELYRDDVAKSVALRQEYGVHGLSQQAIRFALQHPAIHSAILGFGSTQEVDAAIKANTQPV